jgi:serine protease Do
VRNAVAGSGFVITADGYILTNHHVVDGADDLRVSFSDGTTYDAVLVGSEEDNDIAVLKIDATGLTPVVVGNSENLKVGEQVIAIGNPLGELTFTLTAGYVSALDRNISMSDGTVINVLQTDAAINSGNSGGPLFNLYGECIGIVNAKYSNNGSTDASIEGIGFAIPVNDIIDMVTDIMEHGYVTGKPFLGVQVGTVSEAAHQYGVPQGATLETVAPGGAAARAGLKEGDIITAVDGVKVTSSSEFITAMEKYKAGDRIVLDIYREGTTTTASVVLDEKSAATEKALEDRIAEKEEEARKQQQQQQQQYQYNFSWPFGGFNPWGF